jgi:hypothetical protein
MHINIVRTVQTVTGWRRTAVRLEGRHNYRVGNVGQVDQDLRLRSRLVLPPGDQPDKQSIKRMKRYMCHLPSAGRP